MYNLGVYKIFIALSLFLITPKVAHGLVVAPLFIIPILKITVAIVTALSLPIIALIRKLKKLNVYQKIIVFLFSLGIIGILVYIALQIYSRYLVYSGNGFDIVNTITLMLKIFLIAFLSAVVPVLSANYLIEKDNANKNTHIGDKEPSLLNKIIKKSLRQSFFIAFVLSTGILIYLKV